MMNDNGSTACPSPAHFSGPPPLPLFYWSYPSPPLSPPSNYYATMQSGSNPLISPIIGSVQNGFQIARPTGPLNICSGGGGNSTQSSIIPSNRAISQQSSANHFINVPSLESPEIAKAM